FRCRRRRILVGAGPPGRHRPRVGIGTEVAAEVRRDVRQAPTRTTGAAPEGAAAGLRAGARAGGGSEAPRSAPRAPEGHRDHPYARGRMALVLQEVVDALRAAAA